MARTPKLYKIVKNTNRGTYTSDVGTVAELTKYHSYTLQTGESWADEKGNKKINLNPRGIKSLVTNLFNASNNAAANGYSGDCYAAVEATPEEVEAWKAQNNND